MANLKNRVKINNNIINLYKLCLLTIKKSIAFILIILSLYSLFVPQSLQLSNLLLEVTGNFMSVGASLYNKLFTPIVFISNKLNYFKDLNTENLSLKLELARFQKLESDLQLLKTENDNFRKLLNIASETKINYITARLISISQNPFSKSAVIAAGNKQGVKLNQIVANDQGLVGRIVAVSRNYAKIMLVNDFNSRIPVITLDTQEKGILTGNNDQSRIIYISKDHAVRKGEIVVTSGDGIIYPYGITVAEISKVDDREVLVEPIVNLHKTNYVNVYDNSLVNLEIKELLE